MIPANRTPTFTSSINYFLFDFKGAFGPPLFFGNGSGRTRGIHTPPGCAGYAIVPERPTGAAARSAQLRYRHSTGRTFRYGCPGSGGGRRRASSVVADDPATNHPTTLLTRRWDAGTPSASQKAGAHRIRGCMITPGCSCTTRSLRTALSPTPKPSKSPASQSHSSGEFLNSVSSSRFRLGSQKRAPRECPTRHCSAPTSC
jgi:hypothetical protein